MSENGISLVVGLGNPGNQYTETRHNVGFWFLERLQTQLGFQMREEKKFKAYTGNFILDGQQVRVAAPTTFMNLSGQAVAPIASFYRIPVDQILIVHDELDLDPGVIRLKVGGGHGGHNGLRNIIPALGDNKFSRIRIGIGHPGHKDKVASYVLNKPQGEERLLVENALDETLQFMPEIIGGKMQKAMGRLHTKKPS